MMRIQFIILVIVAYLFSGIKCDSRPPDDSAANGRSSVEVANILLNNLHKSLININATFKVLLNESQNKLNMGSYQLKSNIYETFSQMDYLTKKKPSAYHIQCLEDIRQVGYIVFDEANNALRKCEKEATINFENIYLETYSIIDNFKHEADESIRGTFDFCHVMESFNEKPKIFENCFNDRLRYIRLRASVIEFELQSIQAKVIQKGIHSAQNLQECIDRDVLLQIKEVLEGLSNNAQVC